MKRKFKFKKGCVIAYQAGKKRRYKYSSSHIWPHC